MSHRALNSPKKMLNALRNVPFRPTLFEVSGHQIPYMRLEIPLDPLDPLLWLNHQTIHPKIYWENPEEELKIAAIGSAYQLSTIPSFSQMGGPRFFGGMDFFQRKTDVWEGIPPCRYTLPLVELKKERGKTSLSFHLTSSLDLEKILDTLSFDIPTQNKEFKKPLGRLNSSSYPMWKRNIEETLQLITHRKIQKLVLARCSLFAFETPPNPYQILSHLQKKEQTSILFAFEFEQGSTFIGATPEILYHRNKQCIKSVAIAGTRPRGKTKEEDDALKQELLESKKERHEFTLVKETIDQILTSLCTPLLTSLETPKKTSILQTATVQHLFHPFRGTLKEGIFDTDLIRALHPTPAVGGLPRHEAIEEIYNREHFDRGWYGAPVGWISAEEAHITVAIRSALLKGSALRLFSGTGIVEGSDPHLEWEELEHKISPFIVW